ncbi:hypothetical protein P43SY_011369 [Pythium insidiosum]|uniref:N-acetyltransferase domain-containing protein n=1 Tax=Pythium insidiosum TaxID=114742 RepID=A0AAD5MF73_PYTIN|nr:hypothetical protein P43SY_011369 [Pythium insidiosum]
MRRETEQRAAADAAPTLSASIQRHRDDADDDHDVELCALWQRPALVAAVKKLNAGVLPAPVPAHCYKRALNDGVARVSFAAIRRPRPPPPADDAAADGDEEEQVTRVKRRRCDDTNATANVGVDADADAGAVVVGGVLAELDVIHRVVHIQTLAVGAGDRRRGIGRRLVERVIAETRARLIERGVTCVQLHVHVANDDAIAFYTRLGFHEHQRLERYYRHLSPPACLVLRFPLLDAAAVGPRDHDDSPSAPRD